MFQWHMPIDPSCPKVEAFYRGLDEDPMSDYVPSDVIGDLTSDFEKRHRASCSHCQMYGAENVEVVGP